mmetsp:Transcript_92378/g.264774  ORF Transcript_92378/g.264774 Transcript_92378/m.264774 type:complete len:230 (+) Transcript_92378:495-1184(+)
MKVFCTEDMTPKVDGVGGSRNMGSSFLSHATNLGECVGGSGKLSSSSCSVSRASKAVGEAHGTTAPFWGPLRLSPRLPRRLLGVVRDRGLPSSRVGSGCPCSSGCAGIAQGDHGEGVSGKNIIAGVAGKGVLAGVPEATGVARIADGPAADGGAEGSAADPPEAAAGASISSRLRGAIGPARLCRALGSPCAWLSSSFKQSAKLRELNVGGCSAGCARAGVATATGSNT